jgi:general secretion pathway protein D
VTGFSQGYPTISQRQAETAATVRDGHSFVIGGLARDENITTRARCTMALSVPRQET